MNKDETKAALDALDNRPHPHCPCSVGTALEDRIRELESAILRALLDLNAAESPHDIAAEITLLRIALRGHSGSK